MLLSIGIASSSVFPVQKSVEITERQLLNFPTVVAVPYTPTIHNYRHNHISKQALESLTGSVNTDYRLFSAFIQVSSRTQSLLQSIFSHCKITPGIVYV